MKRTCKCNESDRNSVELKSNKTKESEVAIEMGTEIEIEQKYN
jgi:hypothetical protein